MRWCAITMACDIVVISLAAKRALHSPRTRMRYRLRFPIACGLARPLTPPATPSFLLPHNSWQRVHHFFDLVDIQLAGAKRKVADHFLLYEQQHGHVGILS